MTSSVDAHVAPGFPVVGVIGGGQLARMLQQPAIALGVGLRVLATSMQESAAQAVRDVRLGNHDDLDDLRRFAAGCDVITFDHEHVPPLLLKTLEDEGVAVRPGGRALVHAQDKIIMREALTAAGVPCPRWAAIDEVEQLEAFGAEAGWPLVLKTSRGGYDGRGVWVVGSYAEASALIASTALNPGARWLAEEKVDFVQELSAQVARSPHGQAVAYPVVRTVQTNGICTEVVAPAPGLTDDEAVAAQQAALTVAKALEVVGMLAVEMFETRDGRVLVNELAMRPHNSGHWSIDGAVTSQFENHLRAVLDLPLGDPSAIAPYAVMVNVLGGDKEDGLYRAYLHCMARDPGLKIHMYGKDVRPGRKLGHVTVVGDDLDDLLGRAHHAAGYLTGVIDE
ncbi:5-(carboxyamino)imidazole ribonucleotide synthase [Longivirga aurantiaca]|uniref:N5-carboxyaminoimidazole ribonucleotide synthase n=1 Tax=Longivirga aurantiaca TaxID=1837743 RepID=A0ABW1SWT8_9ACTN